MVLILILTLLGSLGEASVQLDDKGLETINRPAYRLPGDIVPRHYNLDILTNLEDPDFSFEGTVGITIQCIEDTDKIVVHNRNLTIDEKNVTLKEIVSEENLKTMKILGHSHDLENEYYITHVEPKLQAGHNYSYFIPFKGILNTDLAGFYRSSYIDRSTNATKWLAVTQFESTDARKAFPCFDEPAMKATFTISIGHHEKYRSLSNMPLSETTAIENKPGWVRDQFKESVPMSTYLVAFLVSDFVHRDATKTPNSNITFRVWARDDAVDQTDFANVLGPKVLSYFETYFNTEYPLPKQDMVAIPDFSAGAMENWGLITYRESVLLYDPKSSSSLNQERIAGVVAHELAHQWFGNLVTMEWWTDLWLNEGFATYVASRGLHYLFPEWNSFAHDSAEGFLIVLGLDSLMTSHPVRVPIKNPSEIPQIFDTISYNKEIDWNFELFPDWNSLTHEATLSFLVVLDLDSKESTHPVLVDIGHANEIDQIFDTISYEKGSYILRMMNLFLGEEVFRAGVSLYLSKHKFGNAKQDDLWAALTEVAHEKGALEPDTTVKMIMDTWTLQSGYPLLTVERQYGKNEIIVTQKRYLAIQSAAEEKSMHSECWRVPLSYTSQAKPNFTETRPQKWLTCDGPAIISDLTGREDQWVIFNIQAAGLVRVNYDVKNWNLLAKALDNEKDFKKIDALNRMQLISDALDLAWTGALDYKTAFSVCKYLKHETEFVPWDAATSGLLNIDYMLRRTPNYESFRNYIRELLNPIFKSYSSLVDTPKDFEGIKLKDKILGMASRYQIGNYKDQALTLFKKWQTHKNGDVNPIPKEIRKNIYCTGIKYGGIDEWTFLWNKYTKSNLATEKATILSALGCSREVWILNRFLDWSINETSGIRLQDSLSVFSSVGYNEVGFNLAKDFFFRKIADIFKYHGPKNSKMGRYLKTLCNQMISTDELNEISAFVEKNEEMLSFSGLAVKQSIESIKINVKWHSRNYFNMPEYIKASM